LDGRYTLFGQLIGGFEVLERLEVGDRILGVTILDEVAPHAAP
jgi:cyclophilin family peptidyl-prolyl cis-trans isomerase